MELVLTVAAFLVELGFPVAVGVRMRRRPETRPFWALVLGAISPLLAFYLSIPAGALAGAPGAAFALGPVWVMSFAAYVTMTVVALLVSRFIPVPGAAWARYFVGLALAGLFALPLILQRYMS